METLSSRMTLSADCLEREVHLITWYYCNILAHSVHCYGWTKDYVGTDTQNLP